MNNLSNWIKNELYPTLFDSIDIAFPEHNFKKKSGNWCSQTYLDGTAHKNRTDKTIVSRKVPGIILEQGGEVISLINYVMKRDGLDFIDAVSQLATIANLILPISTDFDFVAYQKKKNQELIFEDCNNYFTYCLIHDNSSKSTFDYLLNRGYYTEDIAAMELGYIPSQEKVIKYLLSKYYKPL